MTADELKKLEATLWQTADTLRANSDLKSSKYSIPTLGLIFLKLTDNRYSLHEEEINAEYEKLKGTRRERSRDEIAVEKYGRGVY
jgi:type I restriction enzyme M protein